MAKTSTTTIDCVHHWLIEAPAGETSQGVCKHCGDAKAFKNGHQKTAQPQARKQPPVTLRTLPPMVLRGDQD